MTARVRKKISKDGKVHVNLGLPPALAEQLEAAGMREGRRLAPECIHRLTGGDPAARIDPFAGWPAEQARRFRTLGNAVATLASQVTVKLGGTPDAPALLGHLRAAVDGLLVEMGAASPDIATERFMRETGRGLAKEAARAGDYTPLADLADAFGLRETEQLLSPPEEPASS